jgi:hypothetical protein
LYKIAVPTNPVRGTKTGKERGKKTHAVIARRNRQAIHGDGGVFCVEIIKTLFRMNRQNSIHGQGLKGLKIILAERLLYLEYQ